MCEKLTKLVPAVDSPQQAQGEARDHPRRRRLLCRRRHRGQVGRLCVVLPLSSSPTVAVSKTDSRRPVADPWEQEECVRSSSSSLARALVLTLLHLRAASSSTTRSPPSRRRSASECRTPSSSYRPTRPSFASRSRAVRALIAFPCSPLVAGPVRLPGAPCYTTSSPSSRSRCSSSSSRERFRNRAESASCSETDRPRRLSPRRSPLLAWPSAPVLHRASSRPNL